MSSIQGCKGYYDEPIGDSGTVARVAIYPGGVIKITGVPSLVEETMMGTIDFLRGMVHFGPADGDPDLALLGYLADFNGSKLVIKQLPSSRDEDGNEIIF